MSVILYDGKGNIGYYTQLVKNQGGCLQKHTLYFERENFFVGTLGENVYNMIIQEYIKNFMNEYRVSVNQKKFNILDLMKYINKEHKEILSKPENSGVFTTLIYDGTSKPERIFIFDRDGVDEYSTSTTNAVALKSELFKGAMQYCDDLHQILTVFQKTYNHLNSPFEIIKMRITKEK